MKWKDLNILDKAYIIKIGVLSGIHNIKDIKLLYEESLIPLLNLIQEDTKNYLDGGTLNNELVQLLLHVKDLMQAAILELSQYRVNPNVDDPPFVLRILNNDTTSIRDWENPNHRATHKLSVAENDNGAIVYPEVLKINDTLHDFTNPRWKHDKLDALDSAILREDTLRFPTLEEAIKYTLEYKNMYPEYFKAFADGGYVGKYDSRGWLDIVKNFGRVILDKEARRAEVYDSNLYTFDLAYADARNKGQKTFFWNNKYYSTDYYGKHHKLYEEDVKSGKVAAWEEKYPNFTNPELRKAKQEELNTYGITNELTKNKTIKDELLKKIPARGYNINEAISSILGEYNTYKKFSNASELKDSILKKYPLFKDFPFEIVPVLGNETSYGFKYNYNDKIRYASSLNEKNKELFKSFIEDLDKRSYFLPELSLKINDEIHRAEYNLLLGYPMDNNSLLNYDVPQISKYKTGSLPYYYTTGRIEYSIPFIPKNLKKYIDYQDKYYKDYENFSTKIYNNIYNKYSDYLIKINKKDYSDYESYKKAYDEIKESNEAVYKKINEEVNEEIIKKYGKTSLLYNEDLYNKYINNKDYYNNLGIYDDEGSIYIADYRLLKNATNEDLETLAKARVFNAEEIDLYKHVGNNIANSRMSDYYQYGSNDYKEPGKYNKYIETALKVFGINSNPNKYNEEGINDSKFRIYSLPSLGTYTLSIPYGILNTPIKDLFFSIYDVFDINPFGSGTDKPIIEIGKPFEYYTRFYRNEPNIDSLYLNFLFKNGGYLFPNKAFLHRFDTGGGLMNF